MSAGVKHVSDASFEQDVLKADKPVLLDFWAEWCGPCKMIGPILEELSVEYGDRIQIAKMNVDENQGIPEYSGYSNPHFVQKRYCCCPKSGCFSQIPVIGVHR